MAIVPWRNKRGESDADAQRSLAPLAHLRWEMDRMFDRFFGEPWGFADKFPGGVAWTPTLDVAETDAEITVRAEVPGVSPKELEITVAGNVLTLAGEKKESTEQKSANSRFSECRFGSFSRSIQLPCDVDAEKVSAEHRDGVVTIRLKKRHATTPRRIAVKVDGT